jgi:hypothetical protein
MFYAIKTAHDEDGIEMGFYVALHEHEDLPAQWTGATFPTVEEADQDFHRDLGYRVDWQEPDEDAASDVVAIHREPPAPENDPDEERRLLREIPA